MEKEKGWICLHRSIQDHWLWKDEPYDMARAWIDLLLLANHEERKIPFKGKVITCAKGTVHRSIASLSERWHWDRKKTRRFLKLLESDQMVTTNVTTHGTTITIVNYGFYQDMGTTKRTTKRTTDGTTDGQPMDINNNYNNENKNIISISKPAKKKNSFNDHIQNEYDYAAIEKMLEQQGSAKEK